MPKVKEIEHIVKQPDKLFTINENSSIAEAARLMKEHHIGCLLVFDTQDKFIGVLSERDVIAKVLAASPTAKSVIVGDLMTRNVISCTMDTPITKVEQIMAEHKIRHVPIVEKGVPVGIISSRDTISYHLESNKEMRAAAEQLALLSTGLKSLDFNDVIELTVNEAPKNFEAERAILCLSQKGSSAPTIYRNGCPLSAEDLPGPETMKQLCEKKQIIYDKTCNECEIPGGSAPRLVIPLIIQGQHEGADRTIENRYAFLCMCRFNPKSSESTEARIYKATLLQEALSANLTNARLYQSYQKARRDSEIDPLTGAGTRRVLEQVLNTEYARAMRYNRSFSVAIVDIDHFKHINDTAGHAAGDKALAKLAKIMHDSVRTTDIIIVRFGGDEFVLIMPETKLTGAKVLLERLRRQVKTISIPKVTSVTISCGAAEWSGSDDDTPETILQRADEALYKAKRSGRNRVVAGQPAANKS